MKAPVLESLFNRVVTLPSETVSNPIENRLHDRCFPMNMAKILRTASLENTFGGCFWQFKKLTNVGVV